MKTLPTSACLIAALFTFSACSHSVTTAPHDPAGINTGVVYALPKTQLSVTVTYTITKTVKMRNGIADGNPVVAYSVEKPATVTPALIADKDNTFIISGDGLAKDPRLDADFKFTVGDNQLLTAVSAEVTDKTTDAFQSLAGVAISYAKFAAVGGTRKTDQKSPEEQAEDALVKSYTDRIAAIDLEIPQFAASGSKDRLEAMTKLKDERALLVAALDTHRTDNSPVTTSKEVPFTQIIRVAELANGDVTIRPPASYFGLKVDTEVPKIVVSLALDTAQKANANLKLFNATTAKAVDGVYYRVPSRAVLTITEAASGTKLFDSALALAELGPINRIEARYKLWAKRKTSISFSTATGSVSDYGVTSSSSAENTLKALDASAGKVVEAATDLKKQKDDAAAKVKTDDEKKLADLEQKQKLLEAELGVLKAEKALTKEKADDGSGTN